jgi:predicted metal-dependent phosphoesterase TrpH
MSTKEKSKDGFVDLHLHTSASDGSYTPNEIVKIAFGMGLKAIAITDHDTVSGVAGALDAAVNYDIEVIPGIEFSTEIDNVSIHIVGLYVNYRNKELVKLSSEIFNSRENRAKLILKKLNQLLPDIEITFAELKKVTDGLKGRLHIAEILVKKGIVQTTNEAFDTYLGRDAPAYVPRFKFTPKEAVAFLHKINAIPILAHPDYINAKVNLDQLIQELVAIGLEGIEVYYPTHSNEDIKRFQQIAKNYNLLESGGSDCHGEMNDGGPTIGSLNIPYSVFEKIKERAKEKGIKI